MYERVNYFTGQGNRTWSSTINKKNTPGKIAKLKI